MTDNIYNHGILIIIDSSSKASRYKLLKTSVIFETYLSRLDKTHWCPAVLDFQTIIFHLKQAGGKMYCYKIEYVNNIAIVLSPANFLTCLTRETVIYHLSVKH